MAKTVVTRAARMLLAAGTIVGVCMGSVDARSRPALPPCAPLAAHLRSGPLPHGATLLYTDRLNRRHPIAVDGNTVLMGRETSREPRFGGPVHLSLAHLPSARLSPALPGAYPRRTFLAGWQMAWPWIAGIAYTTPLPARPADWRLWAGNVVTGAHVVIDSYRRHRHPVAGFFPHFALNGGRVAWELSTDRPARFDTFTAQQIAVFDLRTRRRMLITTPDSTTILGRITMSGSRLVWEGQRLDATGRARAVDLWLADLSTGAITQLSHNTAATSSSLYPRLQGRLLLFEQGPAGSDFGHPYLVDLAARRGAGRWQWWRDYPYRSLGVTGLTNTQMGAGLVSWDDWQILDLTRSQVWPLRGTPFRRWRVDAIAGRTALVERIDPTTAHVTYEAWQFPATCAAPRMSSRRTHTKSRPPDPETLPDR